MDLYLARDGPTALSWARGGGSARFICVNWEPWDRLSRQGFPAEIWEDRLTPPMDRALREKTYSLADAWHFHRGRDFTLFEGLSLGKASRWIVWTLALRTVYKFAAGIKRLIEAERPARVLCESGVPGIYRRTLEALRDAGDAFAIETIESPPPGPDDCTGVDVFRWSPPSLTLSAGKRMACSAHNAVAGFCSALYGLRERKALLVSSYHSLEPLLELSAKTGHPFRYQFADIPPKHLAPALALGGARIVLEARTPPAWSGAEESSLTEIERAWETAQSDPDYRACFEWEGTPLWRAIGPSLREQAGALFRPLAWAARGFSASWRRDPPSLVLVPSDGPPLQHLLTDLARLHGIPSVLLCHGLPASYSFPMENRNSSHLMVWGEGEAAGFAEVAAGRGRESVVIGNPCFDRYAGRPRPQNGARTAIRRVLVLTHPVVLLDFIASDSDPERHAAGILQMLAAHPQFEVTVKLHPAESMTFYNRCFAESFPGVRFVLNQPMEACIEETDLMIGSFSTALLEAMILEKPILCVNLSRSEFAPPFDGNWGLPVIRDTAGLGEALAGISRDPEGFRRGTLAAYPRILKAFAGPTDGTATRAVLSGLSAIASP